ncbi:MULTISPECIES: hypothetical protein [Peribacillus]|uniref:hypothetical protein n=1 Tax=Peribacillus TaxID=2675229 RepID=UPI00203A3BA9|nr:MULTISPECIES: hypothetical protein [Peribacillus]MCM3675841.1 hypothetical protein [Peribacillus simplex]MDQ0880579.1 hypothetical protein [Peribacillus sp. V2I11]
MKLKKALVSIVTAILLVTTNFVGVGGLNDNKADAAGLSLKKRLFRDLCILPNRQNIL